MRVLALLLLLACPPALARASNEDLQRRFIEGAQAMQTGDAAQAESVFREMLKLTDSPRIKLELGRALFLQGKYEEAKVPFKEVSLQSGTPWRVRDNIAVFIREIEERTGYQKWGVTIVSDSNPRNLPAQKEFSIGDLQVTPTEAPKRMTGLRYSVQGWKPAEFIRAAGYLVASYVDYPTHEFDRLTVDAGVAKNLTDSGRVRGKAGLEFGTFGGNSLYRFPYSGLDAVLAQSERYRLASELKLGKVLFPDFDHLESIFKSGALSLRGEVSQTVAATLRGAVEGSRAAERPYSYYGWDVGPGINTFWPASTFLVGANLSFGTRKYGDADPLFGERREDHKTRLEVTVGNKKWRWRDSYVSLVASVEENCSNIGFYSYRKSNLSIVVD
jgi:hypothetical protein